MLSLPPSVRIFLCLAPADMRRSFDSLALMAQEVVGQDPYSGHLFVFRNRRGDRVKVLYWDRDGYPLWYKRLEKGAFRFPSQAGAHAEVSAPDLALLLEGIDVSGATRRGRFLRAFARNEMVCSLYSMVKLRGALENDRCPPMRRRHCLAIWNPAMR
jgi:transposase